MKTFKKLGNVPAASRTAVFRRRLPKQQYGCTG